VQNFLYQKKVKEIATNMPNSITLKLALTAALEYKSKTLQRSTGENKICVPDMPVLVSNAKRNNERL